MLQTCELCFCGYQVRRRANCSLVNSERRRLERVIKKADARRRRSRRRTNNTGAVRRPTVAARY